MNKENEKPKAERLQKVMAHLGIASRRHAEEMIRQGLVKVNGETVREPGRKVDPADKIEIRGVEYDAVARETFVYLLLYKPEGVITSVSDPRNRKTVLDLLPKDMKDRVYPVGRLDYNTSGLLLLTNDGELTFRLIHPSYGVKKTYRVWIKEKITAQAVNRLESGVDLDTGKTAPAKITRIKTSAEESDKGSQLTVVEITIHEGKNRQVRRMFEKVGFPVVRLQRVAFGPLQLDKTLKPGQYRMLTPMEVAALKKEAGL